MAALEQEVVDKIIGDIKEAHNLALKMAMQHLNMVKDNCDQKVRELTSQNDGLLGAVGKLQKDAEEKDAYRKDLERQIETYKLEYEKVMRERDSETDRLRRELQAESLKREILKVTGKKKGRK